MNENKEKVSLALAFYVKHEEALVHIFTENISMNDLTDCPDKILYNNYILKLFLNHTSTSHIIIH